MFVAATTDCYRHMSFDDAVAKIAHLEFANIEVCIREDGSHITPTEVHENLDAAVDRCLTTQRLNVVGYGIQIAQQGEEYLEVFRSICQLAKATKVVTITVEPGVHGTPFNEEVERYKKLVAIAEQHGVRVGMRTRTGHLSDDPDTVSVICGHVKGLALSLDPSHYLFENENPRSYDALTGYVHQVYLRDSTKDELQVRVGQGVIEYGKLINLLRKENFERALTVDIAPMNDIDRDGEMRKLRLLLESLL